VLDHITDRANLFVEPAAALDADDFGHRDLHALDVMPVPDRLDERVGESEEQQILNRFFPQVVIDPENVRLREAVVQRLVERLRRREIAPERLLDDDASRLVAAGDSQAVGDRWKQFRWNRQIVERTLRIAQRLPQSLVRQRILIVAVHVAQTLGQLREGLRVDATVGLEAGAGAFAKRIEASRRPGDANDGPVEMPSTNQCLKRRENLTKREVSSRAEEHERIRVIYPINSPAHTHHPIPPYPPHQ